MITPRPLRRLGLCLLALLPVLSLAREKLPPEDLEIVEQRWPDAKKTYTGLRYIVLAPGDSSGPVPRAHDKVSVVYKGMLLDGTVFDENNPATPLLISLGWNNLIDGWEEALPKMHKGEKWLLIVPPEMAYGPTGKPPTIKRNATLVFEMELLDFGRDLK